MPVTEVWAKAFGGAKAAIVTNEDVMISAAGMLSVFIREPEFVLVLTVWTGWKFKVEIQDAMRLGHAFGTGPNRVVCLAAAA